MNAMPNNDCYFCLRQKGSIPVPGAAVYSDDLVYANHAYDDPKQNYLGEFYIQTRRHVHHWADLTNDEACAIGLLITRLSRALKLVLKIEHTYVVYYAEVTPHLHVILTARYPDMPKEYIRGNIYKWPQAPLGDEEKIVNLCKEIRGALKTNQ